MKTGIINLNETIMERIQDIPEVNSVKITKEAFHKMNLYSSIVSEIIGDDKECLGTLLNYKNRDDNTARDIHLWKGQKVTASNGWPGEYLDDRKEADKRNMEVIGFWHSHGYNGVFHSSDDDSFLKEGYSTIKNKMVTGKKIRDLEIITNGETVNIFEEGKKTGLVIKGKIEDIKRVEWDKEYFVMSSVVINKNSYSEEKSNPRLRHDYDAEVWAGYNQDVKRAYKKFKHAVLEIVDETNNIQLEKEELVKEVGEKVRLCSFGADGVKDPYLKDLPNYQKVLEKYKKQKEERKEALSVEETLSLDIEEEEDKKKDLTSLVSMSTSPRRITGGGYYSRVYDFYSTRRNSNDATASEIGILGEILSGDYKENGKRCWFWKDRITKVKEAYSKIRKHENVRHKVLLIQLLSILDSNCYAKRKHGAEIVKMCEDLGIKGAVVIKNNLKRSSDRRERK